MRLSFAGILLIATLSYASAFAGSSSDVFITGKVWNLEKDSITIRDPEGRIWRVPRKVLKKKVELRPEQQITVQVPAESAKLFRGHR